MKRLLLVAALLCSSCSAKPIARTVNDVARDLCATFFSEQQGISFEDAARGICATREVLDPFIREVLKAQQAAGAAALGAEAGVSEAAAEEPRTQTVIVLIRDADGGAPQVVDGGFADQ